jgi:hypothetical protein
VVLRVLRRRGVLSGAAREEMIMWNEEVGVQRIADDIGVGNHDEAADYFSRLIIDLKKQLLGHDHDPITMERLNEGTKHVSSIMDCRRPSRYY